MRTRRGLSTVVGMVFSIIALSTTLVYITYSMNTLDQYNQVILSKNQQSLNQNNEKFQVASATFVNNKFNITVVNTGNLPINFTKLWIINTTAWYGSDDKVYYYSLKNSIVTPGGTLKNIGQSVSCPPSPTCSFKTTPAYNIKLVTSRGNSQEFNMNSANSAPLSIQFYAIPSTVPSTGFKTQLIMIVTNNGSNTLTNVSPQTPSQVSNTGAVCTLVQNQASPPSYNILMPGNTAIFKWDLTLSGVTNGMNCVWRAQLVNGYAGNTMDTTATISKVTLASTNYAQFAGTLSINYTTWQWSQGGGWKSNWSIPGGTWVGGNPVLGIPTTFSMQLTNNNSTGTFYISKLTQIMLIAPVVGGQSSTLSYYIVNATNATPIPPTSTRFSCTAAPVDEFCITLPPSQTVTLYFSAAAAGGGDVQGAAAKAQYTGFLVLFGKYDTTKNGSGPAYAQNVPYIALSMT